MSIRDIRDSARRSLHETLSVPALYVTEIAPEEYSEPVLITVRLWTEFMALGDVQGTSFKYAERQDVVPKIIFLRSEVTPARGGIVSIEEGEAWQVDNVLPSNGITVTAEVVKFSKAGLPLPEDVDA